MSKRAEIWKPLSGFEGRYEISNFGNIKNVKRNSIVKTHIDAHGYQSCTLRYVGDKKSHTVKVHRAIALAFIPNPNDYPIINHKDGNKLNNSIENLEWCTYQHNIQHSFDNGLQTPSGQILEGNDYVKIFAMYKSGYLYSEIADALDGKVKERTIYFGLKRKSYLRWFSEREFQKKVEAMTSQLPQKKCYRNHKRINFNMSKRAKEAAMEAYPKEKGDSYRQFGCIKYDKHSEERNAFIKGYEQAEKDILSIIESRLSELLGDAQPTPILRYELLDLVKKIKED